MINNTIIIEPREVLVSTPVTTPEISRLLVRMESLETKLCNLETDMAASKLSSSDMSKKYDTMKQGTIVRIKHRLDALEKVIM